MSLYAFHVPLYFFFSLVLSLLSSPSPFPPALPLVPLLIIHSLASYFSFVPPIPLTISLHSILPASSLYHSLSTPTLLCPPFSLSTSLTYFLSPYIPSLPLSPCLSLYMSFHSLFVSLYHPSRPRPSPFLITISKGHKEDQSGLHGCFFPGSSCRRHVKLLPV